MHAVEDRTIVVDSDDLHCQLTRRNLFLTYTVGPATGSNIQSLVRNFDRFAKESPGPVGFMLATKASTRPPEAEHRRMVQDVMNRNAEKIACVAMCIEATGFTGSIIRSVAAAIFILPNPGYPVKFFSTPAEAVPWVARSVDLSARDVQEMLQLAMSEVKPAD